MVFQNEKVILLKFERLPNCSFMWSLGKVNAIPCGEMVCIPTSHIRDRRLIPKQGETLILILDSLPNLTGKLFSY